MDRFRLEMLLVMMVWMEDSCIVCICGVWKC